MSTSILAARRRSEATERGFSLLEVIFALGLLLVVTLGILPLGLLATTTTENQGHLSARATEYALDKLEQLLVLSYGDTTSDTRAFPATDVGGSGLTVGGSADPDNPIDPYVDYLGLNGDLLPSDDGEPPDDWFYMRVWEVTDVSPANPAAAANTLKQVRVTAIVRRASGGAGPAPRATVVALKTKPF